MRIALLLVAALVIGCATVRVTEFKTADGSTAYNLDCSKSNMEKCYRKATQLCPQGFDPLNAATSESNKTATHSLSIKCGNAKADLEPSH